jgi:hypothetical protein
MPKKHQTSYVNAPLSDTRLKTKITLIYFLLGEQHQMNNGCVDLPKILWPYMPSMETSPDDFLGPRAKEKRPVFQYKKSPNFFLQPTVT